MNFHSTIAAFSLSVFLFAVGCSSKTPASKRTDAAGRGAVATATVSAPQSTPTVKLLFFMNPNGRPCKTQKSILDNMQGKLAPLAELTYVKITESGDRELFEKYGIRGLPTLIITDRQGNELQRLPIGIQSEETILAALQPVKVKP